jgi:putative ABC transport system permease protein
MLTRASLRFYAATNVMVVIGVAVAVAVLAGALLVGSSVRQSLREIALGRLGATDVVVSSPTFFRAALADDLAGRVPAAPLIVFSGAVVHDESRRTAGRVMVYGIDERFGRFHGVDGLAVSGRDALVSPALARELGARAGDSVTVRVAKPTDIPLSTLQGRREDAGERLRLTVSRVLDDTSLAEFSLDPSQGPVFAIYVPMARLQRDLELGDRVNTLLVKAPAANPQSILKDVVAPVAALDDVALRVRRTPAGDTIVESRGGLMPPALVEAIEGQAAREQRAIVPALTYVANAIRIGDRSVPYSTVTAIDLPAGDLYGGGRPSGLPSAQDEPKGSSPPVPRQPPLWLNEWAANDLGAHIGDEVTLDYYLWSDQDGLQTARATFTLRGIVPLAGIGGDRTLTPDYPGISDAEDITSWDPPFPVDLKQVRRRDEDYWDTWGAAPKAIIPLAEGQRLWGSRFGNLSSLRIAKGAAPFNPPIDPVAAGFIARSVRAEALAASEGTTDFGQYFLYFSFFLVVSALLLAYLFFALGLEQRSREVGLLSSVGFSPARIRGAFIREGAVLATVGALVGAAASVAYAAFIMYGLRTWWVGAVGTTALRLHVAPEFVIAGAAGACAAGLLALWFGIRSMVKRSTRALLLGAVEITSAAAAGWRLLVITGLLVITCLLLVGAGSTQSIDPTAAFFGAGACALTAGLCTSALLLRRRGGAGTYAQSPWAVARLGMAQIATRPARTVLSLSLVAFACFVLVSVGAFRKDSTGPDDSVGGGKPLGLPKTSGTGGYTLLAESVAPLMHDPNSPSGRAELGMEPDDPVLANTRISRFRLRPGDEASCLTLYKPTNPRIIAPEARFLDEPRFSFNASLASTDEERANPWRLLSKKFDDGAIPAIADQTTLMYSLHIGVGDDFVLAPDSPSPTRLRIVASLADSMLQSELIIGEDAFIKLFPRNEGYRVWLIDTPVPDAAAVTAHLEDRLSDFGLDVEDAALRWASYHRVENTYLATFQALGALGLLLGTVGLGAVLARNVLERKRELALLRAVGYSPRHIRIMVLSESFALVLPGVLLGTISAVLAVTPAIRERAQAVPIVELGGLLIAVVITGVAASLFAVRLAAAIPVVPALKSE